MIYQRKNEDRSCNCRNSKCMKLYCECFAARVECTEKCHCIDCHNTSNPNHRHFSETHNFPEKRLFKDQLSREHRGCACRKSGCTKKYCQCYQAGILCKDICKCIDCQNNESLSNRKVINELKKSSSNNSNKAASLYPIILTKDSKHIKQILEDENPLNIKDEWIEKTASDLYQKAEGGSVPEVIESLLSVLGELQSEMNRNNGEGLKEEIIQESAGSNIEGGAMQEERSNSEKSQSQMVEQEDAQSPISYRNLVEQQNQ